MAQKLNVLNFQSFLIVGDKQLQEAEVRNLARKFGIQLDHMSLDLSIITPQKNLSVPNRTGTELAGRQEHISIEQIRELKKNIARKPIGSSRKIFIIKEADKLTTEAQNALLKILEEPPLYSIIILQARDKASLLPTIRSRVVTKEIYSKIKKAPSSNILNERNLKELLFEVTKIQNHENWIDEQLISLHKKLVVLIQEQPQNPKIEDFIKAIEFFLETKKMIGSNVNPKFALFNLVFQLQKITKKDKV